MVPNPYVAERLGEEYRKDRLCEAEQARLAREAQGSTPKVVRGCAWMVLPLILTAVLIWLTR